MKVLSVTRTEKCTAFDITTETGNFLIDMNGTAVLLHNSPSIVFGRDPQNSKPFVATKSAFNKTPKINYTHDDIDRNHGHAPGLADKLKIALDHLHKVTPAKGVFQGDIMYSRRDVHRDGDMLRFKPNTITYSAHKDSDAGQKIKRAEIGIVPHTTYHGDSLDNMKASHSIDTDAFGDHPSVHIISPNASKLKYGDKERDRFLRHYTAAHQHYSQIKGKLSSAVAGHEIHLKTYINQCVRNGSKPTTSGYVDHLNDRARAEAGKVKQEKTKNAKLAAFRVMTDHVAKHRDTLDTAFNVHRHLEMAKNALTGTLNRSSEWHHSIGGQNVGPEGFVAARKAGPIKLVHRPIFSRANFQRESTGPSHVIAWGRMNPPTTGHAKLIKTALRYASSQDASHQIIMTHSEGAKDPLTPSQKLHYASQMFPDVNFTTSSKDEPTILHHAAKAYNAGVRNLTVVAGADRVPEFTRLLHKYNGVASKHGHYNFDNINVVSAGDRDEKSSGVEGMSASKQRAAAAAGDFNTFKAGVPGHESLARDLFNDVRKGLSKYA